MGLTRSIRAVAQKGAEKLFNRMGSSLMRHCQTLLSQARRDIAATIWAANADLILHRIGGDERFGRVRSTLHRSQAVVLCLIPATKHR